MYYLRTKPAANALQFTVDKSKLKNVALLSNGKDEKNGMTTQEEEEEDPVLVCSRENREACMMCSA
jgi:ribonucleoside-diphosphate reductase subunit M1